MNHRGTRQLRAATAIALVLAACRDPYQREQAQTPSRPANSAPGDVEGAGPRAGAAPAMPAQRARSAHAAARAFASAWINWDWRTLADQQRALARLAADRLAAELRADAKTAAADTSLARDRPSARGRVIAVDLRADGGRPSAVVVTREQTYSSGHADLGGQQHRVYQARLSRGPHGWQVSRWTPLP
jgi:hypothetical protein